MDEIGSGDNFDDVARSASGRGLAEPDRVGERVDDFHGRPTWGVILDARVQTPVSGGMEFSVQGPDVIDRHPYRRTRSAVAVMLGQVQDELIAAQPHVQERVGMVEAVLPFDAEMQTVDVELTCPRSVEATEHGHRDTDTSMAGQLRRCGTPVAKSQLPRDDFPRVGMREIHARQLLPEHPGRAFGILDGQIDVFTHIPCAD